MNNNDLVKRLSFENFVWMIFVIISLFSIYGDELIKRSILQKDDQASKTAQNLFFVILIITLMIYTYFLIRNYADLKQHANDELYKIRFLGSVFFVVAILCLIYFQVNLPYSGSPSGNRRF